MTIIVTSQSKQIANINNIGILEKLHLFKETKEYLIVAEWSRHAIESFDEYEDAAEFIRGFKNKPTDNYTYAYNKGLIMRQCIDTDVNETGGIYFKMIDLNEFYNGIIT